MTTTRRTFLTAAGCTGLLGLGTTQVSSQSGSDLSRDSFTLMSGTEKSTDVYVTTASESGPTALIVGGMHGNEEAGYVATENIKQWTIERGTLVTIPKANAEAVAEDGRTVDDGVDLNRQFPSGEEPTTDLAREIWGVVEEYQPDVVIDLHESVGIYDGDMIGGVGQVVFTSWDEAASNDAKKATDYLNENYVSRDGYEFSVGAFSPTDSGLDGLLTHKAARDTGALSFLAEVTSKETALDKRVQWHTKLVQQLVEEELLTSSGNEDEGGDNEDDGQNNDEENNDEDDNGDEKNQSPVARIQTTPQNVSDGSLERGDTVTLDASASKDPDGDITKYEWDLDADGSFEASGKTTTLSIPKCKRYPVTLRVTDNSGKTATDEITITTIK